MEFATAELELAQALTDQVVGAVGEPVLAALLLGKAAQAERARRGTGARRGQPDDARARRLAAARDLVTILGNLIDNAVDAVAGTAAAPRAGPRSTVTAAPTGRRAAAAGRRHRRRGRPGRRRAGVPARLDHQGRPRRRARAASGLALVGAAVTLGRGSDAAARRARCARVPRCGCTARGSGVVIRVLVVEDDPVAADAHQLYVGRVPGFEVVGGAHRRRSRCGRWTAAGSTCCCSTSTCRTGTGCSCCAAAGGRPPRRRDRGDVGARPGGGAGGRVARASCSTC